LLSALTYLPGRIFGKSHRANDFALVSIPHSKSTSVKIVGLGRNRTEGEDLAVSPYILFLLLSDCYFNYNYIAIVAFCLSDKIVLALTLIADGTEEMKLSESLNQVKQYDTLVRAGVSCTSAYVPVISSISSDSVHSAKGSTDTGIKIVPDIAQRK
jgi:hypothetical protein